VRRFFEWYQVAIPGLGFPGIAWVWTREVGPAAAWGFMLSLLAFGYVVPGIGTNVTRLYEFRTKPRLGRMRPQQGFLLATFAAAAAWLGQRLGGWWATALICGVLVTLYDALAIRSGMIVVYNRPFFEGRGSWAVALDYAPVFFCSFGAVLGLFADSLASHTPSLGFFTAWCALLVGIPVAVFSAWSYGRHGQSGLWPWRPGHA
jgi:hypothetical protein